MKMEEHVLQERPEDVPVGELPRSMLMVVDRTLVGTIAPGTRVTAVGIYSIFQVQLDATSLQPHALFACEGGHAYTITS